MLCAKTLIPKLFSVFIKLLTVAGAARVPACYLNSSADQRLVESVGPAGHYALLFSLVASIDKSVQAINVHHIAH
jgi:hypothetical protein